jgi:hypothetical protein
VEFIGTVSAHTVVRFGSTMMDELEYVDIWIPLEIP